MKWLIEECNAFNDDGTVKSEYLELLDPDCIEVVDMNLSAGRHKPFIPTVAGHRKPAELIKELDRTHSDIRDRLALLLVMVEGSRVNDVHHCRQHQERARTLETKTQQSLLAYAFSGELTADWREANQEQLKQEAEDRDQWLHENGVKLTIPDARIRDSLKKTDGRHEELNREQRKLLEQIQNLDPNENGGTFTLSSLLPLDEPLDKLTAESARRHLDVLAARGLVKVISRRAGAGGSVNVAFGNVCLAHTLYRRSS